MKIFIWEHFFLSFSIFFEKRFIQNISFSNLFFFKLFLSEPLFLKIIFPKIISFWIFWKSCFFQNCSFQNFFCNTLFRKLLVLKTQFFLIFFTFFQNLFLNPILTFYSQNHSFSEIIFLKIISFENFGVYFFKTALFKTIFITPKFFQNNFSKFFFSKQFFFKAIYYQNNFFSKHFFQNNFFSKHFFSNNFFSKQFFKTFFFFKTIYFQNNLVFNTIFFLTIIFQNNFFNISTNIFSEVLISKPFLSPMSLVWRLNTLFCLKFVSFNLLLHLKVIQWASITMEVWMTNLLLPHSLIYWAIKFSSCIIYYSLKIRLRKEFLSNSLQDTPTYSFSTSTFLIHMNTCMYIHM